MTYPGEQHGGALDASMQVDQDVPPMHDRQACHIRCLPLELLAEIFSLCLPPVPSFRSYDSPMLLTHICHPWREFALNQYSLWDTIYLPSPLEGLRPGTISLCSIWLARSGTRALSIDFHLASDYQPWKISEDHLKAVHDVVRLLIPHAKRVTKLLRVTPQFLEEDLRLEEMVCLDDLFICDTADMRSVNAVHAQVRGNASPPRMIVPPTLRCLSLRQTSFDLSAFSSLHSLAHLDLWQLQGNGQMSLRTCINLLRELCHLESCTLDVAMGNHDRHHWFRHEPAILMPNLSFFFVSWDWLVDIGPILDVLSAPALRRLGLRGPPPTRQHWPHLRTFLYRSRPLLTQLSIKEIGYADIDLLESLKLCPTLTNLSLSHCSVTTDLIRALQLDHNRSPQTYIISRLEHLSLEACDEFDVKELVVMLNTRGKCVPKGGTMLRGLRLASCKRIMECHREELEGSGVESISVKFARVPRAHTR